ncbi:unnamed protein product [Arctia plantaginis]|uniref:Uncharacterized protein n=1 Tax=Arctia plantaginis TaxID=874455 RepID=A0A8S1ABW4_ARCPL|nr:unnamed protein product [Arctia plantaginis]
MPTVGKLPTHDVAYDGRASRRPGGDAATGPCCSATAIGDRRKVTLAATSFSVAGVYSEARTGGQDSSQTAASRVEPKTSAKAGAKFPLLPTPTPAPASSVVVSSRFLIPS